MAVVIFNPQDWLEIYTEFEGKLTDAQLNYAFNLATLLLDNTDASPVPYDPEKGVETRKILLWLLVCHLASLAIRPIGQSGALTSATEGSVSTGFQIPQSPNAAWFNQTNCGASYWQAIRKWAVGGRYYGEQHFHPWG